MFIFRRNTASILLFCTALTLAFFFSTGGQTPASVTVRLLDSFGNPLTGGSLRFYDGVWKTGTDNGDGTFSVSTSSSSVTYEMSFVGARQTKSNIPVTSDTVVFQTIQVSVQLINSNGSPLDTGTVQYYAGSWNDFGTTSGGQTNKELLPYNYKFRMTYAFASNEKYQDVSVNSTVVFQTKNVAVQLQSSISAPLDTGSVKYYAGSWNDFGITSSGQITKELLPYNYKFRMTYAFASNEKYQDVSVNSTVVFQTKNVVVQLQSSVSAPLDTGSVKYYAGSLLSKIGI